MVILSNGGSLNLTIAIKKGTVQEIHPIVQTEMAIYPNPATSFISFKGISGTTLQEVSLVNMKGQLVRSEFDLSVTDHFNVADLPEGLYLVRLISENRMFVKSLIINR
jgi:hypothetical protein